MLIIDRLYLDLLARSDQRLAVSLEDPTRIDPGPLWIAGDKLGLELYLVEVRGQSVLPIALPTGYTCTLNARRADALNDTEIFSQALTRSPAKQEGHTAFTGTLDLTGTSVTDTLAIDDPQLTDGVRLKVQATIAADDNSEIRQPSFIAILRASIA